MARKIGNSQSKKTPAVPVLDDPPPEGKPVLLIRNVRHRIFGFVLPQADKLDLELKLQSQEEKTVSAAWAKCQGLRTAVLAGAIEAEWVGELYQAAKLPSWTQAPAGIRPENPQQENFAMEIALADDQRALELIGITVHLPDSKQVDTKVMRNSVQLALRGAKWAEEQIRNRPRIVRAITTRIGDIVNDNYKAEPESAAVTDPYS